MDRVILERHLLKFKNVERFLGRYYREMLSQGRTVSAFLPDDWDATEADLERISTRVKDFREHWDQNWTGRPEADIFSALAEVTGFDLLLNRGYDRVLALPFSRRKGGGAPDALALCRDNRCLYEIKSLWAYAEHRRYQFRRGFNGMLEFAKRPPGRSVVEANRHELQRHGRTLSTGQYNAIILHTTVRRLLESALKQLTAYAQANDDGGYRKVILLVVTRKEWTLSFFDAGKATARDWLRRRRDVIDDVEWVSGQSSESLTAT